MPPLPDIVTQWLANILKSNYQDPNRTFRDVTEVLSNYPTLSIETSYFTFENGNQEIFLHIKGTIPVAFRGTTYNFPIGCWVLYGYPREAPMVFVTPAQDMLIRPSQHVGTDGRIYHPYLSQWGKYWDKSSINDFVSVLREVFAKDPPVMAKREMQTQISPPVPPPVPPPPAEYRKSSQIMSTPSPDIKHETPPQLPPKREPQAFSSYMHQAGANQGPPLPPLPLKDGSLNLQRYSQPIRAPGPEQYGQVETRLGLSNQFPPRTSQLPLHMRGYSHELESPVSPLQPEPPQQQFQGRSTLAHSQLPYTPREQNNLPHKTSHFQSTYNPNQQQFIRQQQQQQQPKPKPAPIDLLTAPLEEIIPSTQTSNAPAPPIPPNPEKDALLHTLSQLLVAQTAQAISSNEDALIPLRAQHTALRQAHTLLLAELEQIKQLDSALDSNERILGQTMREAERVMRDAEGRRRPEVDELLVCPTVVGSQLYATVAEERACEEARIALARLLDAGRVSVEVFVRQSRSLGREEYLKKALERKIARGMGLDEQRW